MPTFSTIRVIVEEKEEAKTDSSIDTALQVVQAEAKPVPFLTSTINDVAYITSSLTDLSWTALSQLSRVKQYVLGPGDQNRDAFFFRLIRELGMGERIE